MTDYDIVGAANEARKRAAASLEKRLQDASMAIVSTFNAVRDGKRGVEVLDDIVAATKGKELARRDKDQPSAETTDEKAYNTLLGSPNVSRNLKAALRRMFNPRDPQPLRFDDAGTPLDAVEYQQEIRDKDQKLQTAEAELAKVRQSLREASDPNHIGSLAHQLAASNAKAATTVDVDKVRSEIGLAGNAVDAMTADLLGKGVNGKDEAHKHLKAAHDLLNQPAPAPTQQLPAQTTP